jgi:hypothetical protein
MADDALERYIRLSPWCWLFTALTREGLIADELVLQLATFLRSLDLFLELMVLGAWKKSSRAGPQEGGKSAPRTPMRRMRSPCCASVANGHAAAPPSSDGGQTVHIS